MQNQTDVVPSQIVPMVQQAEKYLSAREYQKALDLYDLCLAVAPDNAHLRYCVASLYSELYKSGIAISILRSVVKELPDHAQAWNNLGIAYKNAGQWDSAHEAYSKALELNYEPLTIVNMSGLYVNNGTPQEAIRWAEKGLKLAPAVPQLHNHRALGFLELGKWEEGFKMYDGRFGLPGWHNRKYSGPMWKGEHVKRLLIHGEQGLGDEILFMAALDRVRPRVDEIVIECAERLVPVFEASFNLPCYATEAQVKEKEHWDAWIPMGSLFNVVGFDEHKTKYLKVSKPYLKTDKFRIGISFRGGTIQTHEHLRNFPIEWWEQLFTHEAEFISIQYGPAAGMAKKMGLPHDEASIQDAQALVGMIASCDLVISVCNTSVHMAGGLGIPCWCLTPYKVAWRYGMTGEKMLFYESVTCIRQGKDESWQSVIQRAKVKLEDSGIRERKKAA